MTARKSPVIVKVAGKFIDEDEIYGYDWAEHLDEGEAITSVAFTATGEVEVHDHRMEGTEVIFYVAAGIPGPVSIHMLAQTDAVPPRRPGATMIFHNAARPAPIPIIL